MRRPRVTVIIIVYNGEAFLEEAIASVLDQTFGDWELLIVDDGSTDGSADIARRFEASDSRIRLLFHGDHANHGMSATRNRGLAEARGDFVGFLDADDVWLPQKLEEQVRILTAEPTAALVYGRTLIWRSWDRLNPASDTFYELGVEANRLHPPPVLLRILIENKCQTPTTCSALMRADVPRAVGGFETMFRGMFEDQIFFAKVLLREPVYVSDQVWAKYRQHDKSCSAASAASGEDEAARLHYLRWLKAYLKSERADLRTRALVWKVRASPYWRAAKALVAGSPEARRQP